MSYKNNLCVVSNLKIKCRRKNIYIKSYVTKLRSKNLPTIPSNLKEELDSNIFLRCDQNDLKIKLNMKNHEDFKVFERVRDLKDVF